MSHTTLPQRRRRRPPRPGALQDLSPTRIATQIALLQLAYYASATVLITFSALAAGKPMHLRYLIGWEQLRGDVTEGWMWGLCWLLNAGITAIYLLLLIARSKLVPDFAGTIHFLHLLLTTLYTGRLPGYAFWWIVQAASCALMASLGVWSCRWRELQPINFGGGGRGPDGGTGGRAAAAAAVGGATARAIAGVFGWDRDTATGEGNEGVGYEMGERRRGKGADGAGTYEVVR